MDTIFTTASGNFDNKKSFSGIRKHLEHDPKLKHKNRFLNTKKSQELRKYNSHKVLINFDSWAEEHFGSFVKEHDENMKDKKRRFGSVKRFLQVDGDGQARKLQPVQLYTQKFSNEKDWKAFRNQLIEKLQKDYTWPKTGKHLTKEEATDYVYKLVANSLKDCAEGFNKRNPNLKMFEYYTHLDEEGAPHFHSNVLPYYQPEGLTKKGRKKKPSWSLNTALAHQYGTSRSKSQNKKNLSRFREQEDKALIACISKRLENELGIKNAISFVRLTDKDKTIETGLDHDVYVAKKQKLNSLDKQIESKSSELPELSETVKNKKLLIEKQNKILAENQSKLDDLDNYENLVATYRSQAENAKKEKEDAESARDQALQAQRQAEKAKKQADQQAQQANRNLILQLNQRKQSQDARETDLNRREKGYTDSKEKYHEGIESREKRLNDREKDLNAKELGGKDSQGVEHKGLLVRKNELDNREDALDDRESDLNSFADDLDKAGSTLEKAVQAFTDGFYQGMTNDTGATTEVENLPTLLMSSVTHPFAMVAGFKCGIKKLLKVVKKNKFLETLGKVTEKLKLENLQQQKNNNVSYKTENKKASKSTDSRALKYNNNKEKSDNFGPEF